LRVEQVPVEPEVKVDPKVPDCVGGVDLVFKGMGQIGQPDVVGSVGACV
jgi:hypothetical protein